MYGLIVDRFLKRFLKGSPSEIDASEQGAPEKLNASTDLEKTDDHEKADEQFKATAPKKGTR